VTLPAAPVNAAAAKLELTELLSLGVHIELEATAGFGELRDVEVRVHGVLSGANGASSHGEPPLVAGCELEQTKGWLFDLFVLGALRFIVE
jgi:hypothetical protein